MEGWVWLAGYVLLRIAEVPAVLTVSVLCAPCHSCLLPWTRELTRERHHPCPFPPLLLLLLLLVLLLLLLLLLVVVVPVVGGGVRLARCLEVERAPHESPARRSSKAYVLI